MAATARKLRQFYDALFEAYGPQHWWPGDSRVEIAVGAILTQNTNWKNVERAIVNLRGANCLSWEALRDIEVERLAELIRPAGYYNVKARRLKNLVTWLWERHGGDFDGLARRSVEAVRAELLSINGIGPETADSIVLYALDMPTFVVDAYTARVAGRHGLIDGDADYHDLKALLEDRLPPDAKLFNEYHALLVAVAKRHCRTRPVCDGCPLERFEHRFDE
jgi:endonuclease-3 related protein